MNFKKYHVSRNLFDLATAEDTNIYITNNGGETEATNGDRFIAQQFMVSPSTQYTFSWADTILGTENNSPYIRVSEYNGGSFLKRTLYLCSDYPNKVITIVSSSSTNTFDIRYDSPTSNRGQTITKLMVNTGSTALPYEPYSSEVWHDTPHYIHKTSTDTITTLPAVLYPNDTTAMVGLKGNTIQSGTPTPDNPIMPQGCGDLETVGAKAGQFKIPILSAGQTISVYLGEAQSTRKIKKLVFTGGVDEDWGEQYVGENRHLFKINTNLGNIKTNEEKCTHFVYGATSSSTTTVTFDITAAGVLRFRPDNASSVSLSDWVSWLQQQNTNGNPLTVWIVLANEETAVVNEPLMKIGNYADTVSGITVPTITGKDTFDVETTLKPSETSLGYTGWHDATVEEYVSDTSIADLESISISQMENYTIQELEGGEWS